MEKPFEYELIKGQVIRQEPTGMEGKRLMFMLGTALHDYISCHSPEEEIVYGPRMIRAGDADLLRCELMTVCPSGDGAGDRRGGCDGETCGGEGLISELLKASEAMEGVTPILAVNILSGGNALYDCLDRVQAYRDAGVMENWLIDMERQYVYVFYLQPDYSYSRFSFRQNIGSAVYKGLSFSVFDLLWEEGGCLRDLSVFYSFGADSYAYRLMEDRDDSVTKQPGLWNGVYQSIYEHMKSLPGMIRQEAVDYSDDETYSARAFYSWLRTREKYGEFCMNTELFLGKISKTEAPSFRHQFIQGNLYFALRSIFREKKVDLHICFSPMAVQLKGDGILDCVLRPDIFFVEEEPRGEDMVCKTIPLWVIEIVQPSGATRDYIDKEQIYHYHGVGEYWIINDWKKQVMVLNYNEKGPSPGTTEDPQSHENAVNEEGTQIKIYSYEDEITPECIPQISLRMSEVLE